MDNYIDHIQRSYPPTGTLYKITDSQITSLLPNYTPTKINMLDEGVVRAFKDIMAVILYQNLSIPIAISILDGQLSMSFATIQIKEIIIKPDNDWMSMIWIEGKAIYSYPKQMEIDVVLHLLTAPFTTHQYTKV